LFLTKHPRFGLSEERNPHFRAKTHFLKGDIQNALKGPLPSYDKHPESSQKE
jgi:hypothetical protein